MSGDESEGCPRDVRLLQNAAIARLRSAELAAEGARAMLEQYDYTEPGSAADAYARAKRADAILSDLWGRLDSAALTYADELVAELLLSDVEDVLFRGED